MSSNLELRFHFSRDVFWIFCLPCMAAILNQMSVNNKMHGDAFKPYRKCDVPWCKRKGTLEFYPERPQTASLWVPEKKK